METCTADSCKRPIYARHICAMHYQRLRIHGSLDLPVRSRTPSDVMCSLRSRFEKRYVIAQSGCWLWTGPTYDFGYGRIRHQQCTIGAHRASWLLNRGDIPDGMLVCHKCDVPACVNPEHLFIGTFGDNNRDCTAKGRQPGNTIGVRGELHWHAGLNERTVIRIRAMHEHEGLSPSQIARIFGSTRYAVSDAIRRKSWAHVP